MGGLCALGPVAQGHTVRGGGRSAVRLVTDPGSPRPPTPSCWGNDRRATNNRLFPASSRGPRVHPPATSVLPLHPRRSPRAPPPASADGDFTDPSCPSGDETDGTARARWCFPSFPLPPSPRNTVVILSVCPAPTCAGLDRRLVCPVPAGEGAWGDHGPRAVGQGWAPAGHSRPETRAWGQGGRGAPPG